VARREILFDLTQFLCLPVRSGIQRVIYEIIRHWAGPYPLVPAWVGQDARLYVLPQEVLTLIPRFFQAAATDEPLIRDRFAALVQKAARRQPVHVKDHAAVLNPELFYRLPHIEFYEQVLAEGLGERVFFILYDLLAWWHPEWFHSQAILMGMPYVRLVRRLPHLAYISEATRREYGQRLLRREVVAGPVLSLGADGMGVAEPAFDPGNRRFTVVSTVEPRKNQAAVLDAFAPLWAEGLDVELVFSGRPPHTRDGEIFERILTLQANQPRFQWIETPDDEMLRTLIRGSRATIFPSRAEGFGLPPLESLALGIPVIVSESIPSVAMLEPLGQVRVHAPTAEAIRRGVLDMCDDTFAASKHEEIRRLRLPRWSELGPQLGQWIVAELATDEWPPGIKMSA
jgi:glycosyltransferase involved in cell wall biosynthesis